MLGLDVLGSCRFEETLKSAVAGPFVVFAVDSGMAVILELQILLGF